MQDQVMITLEADEELVQQLLGCSDDPLAFVNLAFPDIKPEKWQREVLKHIGNQLQENTCLDRWKAVMVAVASGNGIGKSALGSHHIRRHARRGDRRHRIAIENQTVGGGF